MITSPSDYLIGTTKIPNAISRNAGEPENLDLLDIIERSERGLLLSLLGASQYSMLFDELQKLPFNIGSLESAAVEWVDFVNGKDDWIGAKQLCKNYVYCKYIRFIEVSVTTTGAGKSKVKNFTVTDYNQKYVERWNELTIWINQDLYKFIDATDGIEIHDHYPMYQYENQLGF